MLHGLLQMIDGYLLGEVPSLTRLQVCEQAGVPLAVAEELWRLLGFPHASDDEVAFTPADVEALRHTQSLMRLGVLSAERQSALVRTWGRSFARLAEWQVSLITDVAVERGTSADDVVALAEEIIPRVEQLQNYAWRRHLASAASRLLATEQGGQVMAVGFVDIVGYTSRSKELSEQDLVAWIEHFEDEAARLVVEHGGRIIKNLGDAVLYVSDSAEDAVRVALTLAERGEDPDDPFPAVRAGLAHGEVVARLGDVFGPTVNIASRLTSIARPGSVVVDDGVSEALVDVVGITTHRMRRTSVKGYSRLQPHVIRRESPPD